MIYTGKFTNRRIKEVVLVSNSKKQKMPKRASFNPGTIKRLLSYLKQYRVRLIIVMICILISAGASVASSLFLQTLIDDYIGPLLIEAVPDFGGLKAHLKIFVMKCFLRCRSYL